MTTATPKDDAQSKMNLWAPNSANSLKTCSDLICIGNNKDLAVVVHVPLTMQNLVFSHSCFAKDGEEMNKYL